MSRFYFVDGRQNLKEAFSKWISRICGTVSRESKSLRSLYSPCTGRYESEFQEISILGKGGFGTVYKVSPLLSFDRLSFEVKSTYDNAFYAVKKIKLKKADDELTGKVWVLCI